MTAADGATGADRATGADGTRRAAPPRASGLLGRAVFDAAGAPVGRIADLIVERDATGRWAVRAAIVVKGPWGRLLGYERATAHGPWLLETLARMVLRRESREVPWREVRLDRGE